MARKGILSTGPNTGSDTTAAPSRRPEAGPAPRGAVGALQSSLTKLQENAVQEIAPEKILDAGVTDRLGEDAEADAQLQESLKTYGQQVPVLVRPHAGQPGLFDIVYGRRRLRALKALGLPVKAMVRQLDDQALVLAQGQENTARKDLTFIEKASFAAQLDAQDYDRQTICAALSIDAPMLSRMLKVGRAFDIAFLKHIGSAPGIGRDRWIKLAESIQRPGAIEAVEVRLPALDGLTDSDTRFEQVFAWASGQPAPKVVRAPSAPSRKIASEAGYTIAKVKRSEKALVLTLPHGDAPAFTHWVDAQAEDLVQELYDRWLKSRADRS
ncbi:plasmid partitioning protein RepB [Sagittula salina]|uniref:Plasmid partitioning protein RepB n=1 Tax=Sagittula salina TaxID=2820268 RepID=A0A940MTK9_9RHOB|nr:plasmid partitioning protein RepB [Sagittula salina]MBP0484418.1 plasmid partitioning protein RepB [Sagittula salina]